MELGLTQDELADEAGLDDRVVVQIENAEHAPDLLEIFKLTPADSAQTWRA